MTAAGGGKAPAATAAKATFPPCEGRTRARTKKMSRGDVPVPSLARLPLFSSNRKGREPPIAGEREK